tara:strand:- start:362 stop:940 length:579 start_codon:yes stop_codon:yes gene_type:complete
MCDDFVWPSDRARAENDELDRVCDYLEDVLNQLDNEGLPPFDPSRPREEQGLYGKFYVRRVDGSDLPGGKHFGCRYFVLDVDHDKYAAEALGTYANACEQEYPELAKDLRQEFGATSPGSEWVRCSERLPTVTGHYCVALSDPDDIGWSTSVSWTAFWNGDGFEDCDPIEDGQPVTHWMPLPQPPKSKEGES